MANIPQADIDSSGVFKYVLIKVHSKEKDDDSKVDIVRGYSWAEYHGQCQSHKWGIYDEVQLNKYSCEILKRFLLSTTKSAVF